VWPRASSSPAEWMIKSGRLSGEDEAEPTVAVRGPGVAVRCSFDARRSGFCGLRAELTRSSRQPDNRCRKVKAGRGCWCGSCGGGPSIALSRIIAAFAGACRHAVDIVFAGPTRRQRKPAPRAWAGDGSRPGEFVGTDESAIATGSR
jgi:hypothetical protein